MPVSIGNILNIISVFKILPVYPGYCVLICNTELPLKGTEVQKNILLLYMGPNFLRRFSLEPHHFFSLGFYSLLELFVFFGYLFEVGEFLLLIFVSISGWHKAFMK